MRLIRLIILLVVVSGFVIICRNYTVINNLNCFMKIKPFEICDPQMEYLRNDSHVEDKTLEKIHECFHLYRNLSYFRSLVRSNSTGTCRLITHFGQLGRVGNQMFQVAGMIGIAHHLDMIPVININIISISKYFDFPNAVNYGINNTIRCSDAGWGKYSDCVDTYAKSGTKPIEVYGYRQSWKYQIGVLSYIRNVFTFKESYLKEAKSFIANNSIPGHDNTCIHVRRGDMIKDKKQDYGYTDANYTFYSKAMEIFRRKLKYVNFIVVSDDIPWCKDNFEGHVSFSPYTDPGIDMAILSLCDHMIVSSGTFGWWGAWLSDGMVVFYKDFPKNGSQLSINFEYNDYYPPHWIGI